VWCMYCCWGISDIEAHLTPRLQLVKVEVVLGGIEINDVHPPRVIGCLGLIMVGNRIPWHAGGISDSGVRSIALRRHSCSEHRLVWREAASEISCCRTWKPQVVLGAGGMPGLRKGVLQEA
jgi:hypothetical protein